VEQELLTLPENPSSPPVSSGVRVTRSLVLYVCFVDRCLSFCIFSFGHCFVCPSIYGFWLLLWYLQTLLTPLSAIFRAWRGGHFYWYRKLKKPTHWSLPIIGTLDCMECTPTKVRIDFNISCNNVLSISCFLVECNSQISKEINDLFEYKLYLHAHLVTFYQEKMPKG
jgi:hypothetical protein